MKSLFKQFLAAAALCCFAASASADSLIDVFKLALEKDPELAAAKNNHRATIEARPQARAGLLPSISASGSRGENELKGGSDFTSENFSLSVTQPVFNYISLMKFKQAGITVKKSNTDLSAAYQNVIVRVTERYFAVLTSIDKLEFARAEKRAIARQLEQARKRFEVGLIAITNVHEAKAAYDLASSQVIAAENDLANKKEALSELTNKSHVVLAILQKNIPLITPKPVSLEKWTQIALAQNLRLRSTQYDVDIARAEIKVQRGGHYPSLDIVASHNKNESTGGAFPRDTETDSVELQLKIPIFSGGFTASKTRQARHTYRAALDNLEKERRSTLRQTKDAYRGVIAGISQVKALKQAIVSSQSALKATTAGYRVGTRTIVDVLNAQRELFRAKSNYTDARHKYILDLMKLKQAAGTLSDKDIAAINQLLRPSPTK